MKQILNIKTYWGIAWASLLLVSTFFTLVLIPNPSQAFGLILVNGLACFAAVYYGRWDNVETMQKVQ